MKTKSIEFKAKAVQDDGFFSGYASVFDVKDSYGDIVKKGAFLESINELSVKSKKLPILWQHKTDEVIGVWHKLYEDENGLYGEGQLFIDDISKAKETYALLKNNAIDGLSIGYQLNRWQYNEEQKAHELIDIDLKEISIVTMPANQESRINSIKSTLHKGALSSLQDFEAFLVDAGFNQEQAAKIADGGLKNTK